MYLDFQAFETMPNPFKASNNNNKPHFIYLSDNFLFLQKAEISNQKYFYLPATHFCHNNLSFDK